MRNTVISSTFAVVVTRVVNRLAVAVVAVRTLLHHTYMREQHGQWRDTDAIASIYDQRPECIPGLSLKRLSSARALALCPAYAASARSFSRG